MYAKFIVTVVDFYPKRRSICLRLSSNGPHRLDRRLLSCGASITLLLTILLN
jgi:hypothetical protein